MEYNVGGSPEWPLSGRPESGELQGDTIILNSNLVIQRIKQVYVSKQKDRTFFYLTVFQLDL